MQRYTSTAVNRPPEWDRISSPTRIYHNTNIEEIPATDTSPRLYRYTVEEYTPAEYAAMQGQQIEQLRAANAPGTIAFVWLAEDGQIDDVTAAEHVEVFTPWAAGIAYIAGELRSYDAGSGLALYRCAQNHTAQADWSPDATPALWVRVADPGDEWPAWSQPIGAHDAYGQGDQVTHDGKHWRSDVDANVWAPGVYGWTEVLENA